MTGQVDDHQSIHDGLQDPIQLAFGFPQRVFCKFAFGDITEVALDHLLVANLIEIADKLHIQPAPVDGFERQVFITDMLLSLQFFEGGLGSSHAFEWADFPESFP